MSTQHTPGPWIVINGWDKEGNGKYFPSVVLHSKDIEDIDGRNRITINVSHDQEIPSLMANANLIASAPELLEALQKLSDQVAQSCPIGSDRKLLELFKAHQLSLYAIKKATNK